jgi:hypothetical protein
VGRDTAMCAAQVRGARTRVRRHNHLPGTTTYRPHHNHLPGTTTYRPHHSHVLRR